MGSTDSAWSTRRRHPGANSRAVVGFAVLAAAAWGAGCSSELREAELSDESGLDLPSGFASPPAADQAAEPRLPHDDGSSATTGEPKVADPADTEPSIPGRTRRAALFRAGPSQAQLEVAIQRAAEYLIDHCDDQGRFVYRADPATGKSLGTHYNLLRHAGAVYALAMYHDWQPDDRARTTMIRAAGFLRRESIRPLPTSEGDLLAVWSLPEVTGEAGPAEIKLGGTGLGLLAFCSAERIAPGTFAPGDFDGLADFLVFMQRPDGSFYSKFLPHEHMPEPSWTSLYYPGEAALGLLTLYEYGGNQRWLDAAIAALVYLAESRRESVFVPADHWALLATGRLFSVAKQERRKLPATLLCRHAAQICRSMLAARPQFPLPPPQRGCLTGDGRTCPTATRVEGMLAALVILPESTQPLPAEIAAATSDAVGFLLRNQLTEGPCRGGIPAKVAADGRSTGSAAEIRVDFVQHALSAMIQLHRWGADSTDAD